MICIKIDDRDQVLHQWDTGQRLVLQGVPGGAKVDFYHEGEEPLGRESYEEDGAVYADIPDVLLQAESKLYACIRVQDETVGETVYKWFAIVHPRPKPSDYIYTEEEKKTWEELQAQIDELKENGAGNSTLVQSVNGIAPDENGNVEIDFDDPVETDPTVFDWAKRELFNKADLPTSIQSFVTVDGIEYYRYHAGATYGFTWYNPSPLPGAVTITARMVNQYHQDSAGLVSALVLQFADGTYYYLRLTNKEIVTYTTDASKTLSKIRGNYDLENWVLLDMSVMSVQAEYNRGLPLADSNAAGGVLADPATDADTIPARIKDGRLFVAGATDEQIAQAVSDYMADHPIEVPDSSQNVDLTGYAKEQWVKDNYQPKGEYLTEVPEGYAKTEDIPTEPEDIGADPKGTAASAVSEHNVDTDSHNDIRLELKSLSDRLTAFFDSDDATLDELSEIVAYITSNKSLIDSITTSKINVADIVNNLTTNVATKPLSAAQGVVLKGLIDTLNANLSKYALASAIPTKVSQLQNDAGYLNEHQDISGKLDASELPTAINTALAQAKSSGEFDGAPGKDGADGQPGKDGTSPVVSVSAIKGGHRITITDTNGTKTVDVMDGVDGSDGENAETVPDYVRTEAERVADNVLAVRNGKSFVFAASSDAHIGLNDVSAVSAEHAGMGMKCIREITNLDMIVHLGDYIEGASDSTKEASKAEYKKYHSLMYDACVGIPTVWEKGNHDANYQGVEAFSLDECFAYIGANNQGNHVVEYGNESRMYGYLDFESKRLRVIYLNSSDAEFKTGVSSEQATWLSTTAFDFSAKENPAEWGWIILIHIPVTFVDNARLLTAINAYSGEAEPIAIFHGHCHNFRTEQVSNLNIWQIGIPELCVGRNNEYATQADYSAIFGELDESGTPVYHNKETGNAKDTSFNVVTIDRKNHKIYAHVFGAGIDRILEYTGNVSYTNLFNSADADFKTDSRISESSGIGSMDDSWVTGFIPAVSGDVIRVRFPNGKSVKYADGYTRAVISMHDSAKTLVPLASYYSNTESNVTVDADGLGYTATIGKDDTVYIRCAGYGDYAGAIITKNEQIV